MKILNSFILTSLFLLTLPSFAEADLPDTVSLSREAATAVFDRLPTSFLFEGKNAEYRWCKVDFVNYTAGGIPKDSRALTRTDFSLSIHSHKKVKVFDGSWHAQGGRGGCASVPINYPRQFLYRQDGGVDYPCFAMANKVFHNEGYLEIFETGKGTVFSVKQDGDIQPTICIIPQKDILKPFKL